MESVSWLQISSSITARLIVTVALLWSLFFLQFIILNWQYIKEFIRFLIRMVPTFYVFFLYSLDDVSVVFACININ